MPSPDPQSLAIFGTRQPSSPPLTLRAGRAEMVFEPDTGFLRRVHLDGREVIRCVYAAVRDRDWRTIPATLSNLNCETRDDRFQLFFDAECREGPIHFRWTTRVEGGPDGTISVAFDGEALSTFWRNRIGLCVLHPIRECAGAKARQKRTDGSVVECRFPTRIEPQILGRAGFQNLRAVAHEVREGQWANLSFTGDTFEMEDQRNWSDGSFKTYCTPLAEPFPAKILAGTRIPQSVMLRFDPPLPPADSPVIRTASAESMETLDYEGPGEERLPELGACLGADAPPLSVQQTRDLRSLDLAHLRIDLRLADPAWIDTLRCGTETAKALDTMLEAAIHLPREEAVDPEAVSAALGEIAPPIKRVLALREGEEATSPATLAEVRRCLADNAPIPLAGSDCNFCELNRAWHLGKTPDDADALFWSMAAEVHATDLRSVIETLETQPDTLRTASDFVEGSLPAITPITFRQRSNPVATSDGPETARRRPVREVPDPRQASLFAAAWMVGCVAAMAGQGCGSATFFEATGSHGLLMARPGPATSPYPVYHIFQALVGHRIAGVHRMLGARPLTLLRMARNTQVRTGALLANLCGENRRVRLDNVPNKARVSRLDPGAGWLPKEAPRQPGHPLLLHLGPYAVIQIHEPEGHR